MSLENDFPSSFTCSFDISLLTKSLDEQRIVSEADFALPILKSPLLEPKKSQNPQELESNLHSLHLKLMKMLKAKPDSTKIKNLLAICDLQVLIFLKFQESPEDVFSEILSMMTNNEENFEELKEFFWKSLSLNNQEILPIFLEKLQMSDWIALIFHSGSFFESRPNLEKTVKLVVLKLIEENEEFPYRRSKLLIEIVKSLDIKSKGSFSYILAKEFIRLNIIDYQLAIEEYVMDKTKQKSDEIEGMLRALYTLYKFNPVIVIPIFDNLEIIHKSLVKNKNLKNLISVFFGRVASFKNSRFYLTHARILESFFYWTNDKVFLASKKNEIIQILFRIIKKFYFFDKTPQKTNNNLDEQVKLLKFCKLSEKKILELLFLAEKSFETKQLILDLIYQNTISNPFFFSLDFFANLANSMESQIHQLKEKCSILLAEVFAFYYSAMFTDNCNLFYNTNRVIVNEGQVECQLHNIQEKSQRFEYIFLQMLHNFNKIEKKEYLLSLNSMNHVFFGQKLKNRERTSYIMGIFYLVMKNYFASIEQFPDFKTKGYDEFLSKILGSEWKINEENKKDKKPLFIIRGLENVLKAKRKISSLIKNWMNEKIKTELFLEKMEKYSDFIQNCKEDNGIKNLRGFCLSFDEDQELRVKLRNFVESRQNGNCQKKEKTFLSDDMTKNCSHDLLFFLDFLDLNKDFDQNIVDEILKNCLYFVQQLRNFENEQEMFFLISGLKAVLFLIKSECPFENLTNLNTLIEISQNLFSLFELKKPFTVHDLNKIKEEVFMINTAPSTTTYRSFEMATLKRFALSMALKIASKFNNFIEIQNPEEKKAFFEDLIKLPENKDSDYKYLATILLKLDEVSSEKVFLSILENSITTLDVRSINLSKNVNQILSFVRFSVLFKDSKLYITEKERHQLLEKYIRVIEKPVVLSKSLVISNLSINKMKTLNLIYLLLFKIEQNIEKEETEKMAGFKESFLSTLFEILINFSSISASSLLADKNYLRIKVLEILFKIISENKLPENFTPMALLKLSYLCFDENLTFRKVFFKYLIKFISHLDHSISLKFLSLVVFFTLDEDPTLNHVSKNVVGKYSNVLGEKIKVFLEDKKVFSTKIFETSPEYLLIYLVFLVMNNIYFSQKDSRICSFKVLKLMQNFFDLVFQHNSHFRALSFLAIILENLKRKKSKILNISPNIDFSFYVLSKKTINTWNKQIPESGENKTQNSSLSTFTTSSQSEEEKYESLMKCMSDFFKKNFDNKRINDIKNDIIIPIDSKFFESKQKIGNILQREEVEEKLTVENSKVTEKKTLNVSKKATYNKIAVSKNKENIRLTPKQKGRKSKKLK